MPYMWEMTNLSFLFWHYYGYKGKYHFESSYGSNFARKGSAMCNLVGLKKFFWKSLHPVQN